MVQDPDERVEEHGPYHIIVCQASLATTDEIEKHKEAFQGEEIVLQIWDVWDDGHLVIDWCPVSQHSPARPLCDC